MTRWSLSPTALIAALAGTALTLVALPLLAAPDCKGSEQEVCETREECRWVSGYTRKDGIEVSGHCRTSGKKVTKTEEPPQEASGS